MNTTQTNGVILKTDALGRVKTLAARHEALLDEFEHSGMSGVTFAEFAGIKYQTFATCNNYRFRKRRTRVCPESTVWSRRPEKLRQTCQLLTAGLARVVNPRTNKGRRYSEPSCQMIRRKVC